MRPREGAGKHGVVAYDFNTGSSVLAHVRCNNGTWQEHLLADHLSGTSRIAAEFASPFGNDDWARAAGLWHDLGKFKPAFQAYLREQTGYDGASCFRGGSGDHTHSIVGAMHAVERWPLGRALAYVIAGHHGGLPDWNDGLCGRLQDHSHLDDARLGSPDPDLLGYALPTSLPCGTRQPHTHLPHLWIRMLFSCLVDADFLDTEAFMQPERAADREAQRPGLHALLTRLNDFLRDKTANAPTTSVNNLRAQVLSDCRAGAALEPGLFSLTVPTGGGKTLSSMAFALEHAIRHGKRRVIVAIPYTSIIEQTAEVFRSVFGEDAVLEHHSNVDPERGSSEWRSKAELASENWDAPIVVTTNVQLFESLFAARTSSCRKLHNIAGSVVILDEAQMLPPEYLKPILGALQVLTSHFGVSVVLCTATQPVLTGSIGSGQATIRGLANVRELMPDKGRLARELRRVSLRFRNPGQPTAWEELAPELSEHEQVLCIVNTRKHCRALHALMPEGTIHLSALMCPEHRSVVIRGIKDRLRLGEPVRVVSTQLVEAGVDLDFPVVYRAMAGLDSIAQAAGRCNREGKLQGRLGEVVVFTPPDPAPPGLLRKGQDAGAEMIRCHAGLVKQLGPEAFDEYFRLFYGRVNDFDLKKMDDLLVREAQRLQVQFRTAAERFKLIDDAGRSTVIVWYGTEARDSRELIARLKDRGLDRWGWRKLQRFGVSVPEFVVKELASQGAIEEVEGVWVQAVAGLYDDVFGLRTEGPSFTGDEFIC